ncbi:MAG TPA: histidine--tRNA ligase [Candidatus Saccharimonadales bacterium]|nr:histidine--tRNA ligase [Candidatus Saccharimonadales bacterium]
MSLNTQPYKGTRDFYPEDKRIQKYMFGKIRSVVESFGYQEYDAPILESFDIYAAKTGEEIVNEQLYYFEDKGGRKVAIRPEMTPSVSRMVAARRQELAYPLRWYSIPNLWRYEQPQRGRLREHWQLNVDIFGVEGLEGDAEIIQVADAVLQGFGASRDMYEIRINSRKLLQKRIEAAGPKTDVADITRLIDHFEKLSQDEFKASLADKVENPGELFDFLTKDGGSEETKHLEELLNSIGITNVRFVPSLARGFDYYTDIVFEVFDTNPENNRSMFGGGRYDGLVALFGVEPVPTVGFGMGDVTLRNFLESHDLLPKLSPETDAIAILIGDVYNSAQKVLSELRSKGVNIAVDSSGRKLDMQLKHAIKSGTRYALFIGEAELSSGQFKLRDLEKGREQQLPLDQVAETLGVR